MKGAPASAMDLAQALAAARAKNPDLAVVVAEEVAVAVRTLVDRLDAETRLANAERKGRGGP